MPSSEVMHKWKHGQLHSGSKKGPKVKSEKQALAIMFSEKAAEAKHGGKYPEKRQAGGPVSSFNLPQPPNPMMGAPGSPSMGTMTPMAGVAAGMNNAMGPVGVAPGQMPLGGGGQNPMGSFPGFTGQPGGGNYLRQIDQWMQNNPRFQNDPRLQQMMQRIQSLQSGTPQAFTPGQYAGTGYGGPTSLPAGPGPSMNNAPPLPTAMPTMPMQGSQPQQPIQSTPPIGVANQPSGVMPMIGQPNTATQMIGQPRALGGVAQPGVGNFNMGKQANINPSPTAKSETRNVMHGPVMSAVSGRTDAHKTAVPSGSYVIPADVVSGRGQGNTLAGMNILQRMFKMGPYGSGAGSLKPGRTMPGAMRPPKMQSIMGARGGGKQSGHVGKPTPVHLAGGELVVPPANLMQTVHPNLKTAHEIMDKWVLKERKKHIKTLGKLPGPVKE